MTDRPDQTTDDRERQLDADDVPLAEGAVRNGGAFMGGASPEDAEDASDEPRQPLDSRTAFGGDGARYVDPAIAEPEGSPKQRRAGGFATGDDGADELADRGTAQDLD